MLFLQTIRGVEVYIKNQCLCETLNDYNIMKDKVFFGNHLYCGGDKPVHVNAYTRIRFGRLEFVREYCRANWGSLRKKVA